jgi:hypothetical protein
MIDDPLPRNPWSIGIYAGASAFALAPPHGIENPIMTREKVTDVPAAFVADPFLILHDSLWHMFFEVMHHGRGKGEIGWAHSADAIDWRYGGIVLREPIHLSYPHVFEYGGAIFMVPETLGAEAVRLYRAEPFPRRWVHIADLLSGPLADPTPFWFDDHWWMFACATPTRHDTLSLFVAEDLTGSWREHRASPVVVDDKTRARPAGRVLVTNGCLYRFAQDCGHRYGGAVRTFVIDCLTEHRYSEREEERGPMLGASGAGWNGKGMHHVDIHPCGAERWVAAVDGIAL